MSLVSNSTIQSSIFKCTKVLLWDPNMTENFSVSKYTVNFVRRNAIAFILTANNSWTLKKSHDRKLWHLQKSSTCLTSYLSFWNVPNSTENYSLWLLPPCFISTFCSLSLQVVVWRPWSCWVMSYDMELGRNHLKIYKAF